MAVAWIGNREALLEHAVERAAALLKASRCPVIIFETDVHGTRAIVSLAERIGAAYDCSDAGATLREAGLISGKGAITVSPGEARRRADLLVLVGEMPAGHEELVAELIAGSPDLVPAKRAVFSLAARTSPKSATSLSAGKSGAVGSLAALRAQLAGHPVATPIRNFDAFAEALQKAAYTVFVFSGLLDLMAMEMLQGLVADINKKQRATTLHLPASVDGWGSVLASTWMTGFPPRTSFARGMPEYDPWQFDAQRMIADGEADVVLSVGSADAKSPSSLRGEARGGGSIDPTHVALTTTSKPLPGAAVTIRIGAPGVDHEAVRYTARLGTFASVKASKPSDRPDAASVIRAISDHFGQKVAAS